MNYPRPHANRLPGEGHRQHDRDHGRRPNSRDGGSPDALSRDTRHTGRRVMPENMTAMFDRLRDAAAAHDGDTGGFGSASKTQSQAR